MRGESLSGPVPRRVGIRDVARRAEVAISTVSKVFSGRGEVMPALRDRVVSAASELGYEPNYVAQSLRRGATKLIGFVASDLSDPFSAEIIAGIEYVLRQAGYALLVMSCDHDAAIDAANIRHLNSRRADAILLYPSSEDNQELLDALGEFDGPLITLESELRTQLPVGAVRADQRAAMADVIRRLRGLGHSRIAALTGPQVDRPGRERLAGLLDGLRAGGLEQQALPLVTANISEEGEAAILRALEDNERPTAIVACSLPLLTGALRALQRRSLKVGSDISLVGWDDVPLAQLYQPPIAMVHRDPRALGAAAARMALRRLGDNGENPGPNAELLAVRFIQRASCMPSPRRPSGEMA